MREFWRRDFHWTWPFAARAATAFVVLLAYHALLIVPTYAHVENAIGQQEWRATSYPICSKDPHVHIKRRYCITSWPKRGGFYAAIAQSGGDRICRWPWEKDDCIRLRRVR